MSFSRSQWDRFLSPGGALVDVEDATASDDLLGTQLGAFELSEVIGRGGMATVFRAERVDGHFDQTVAIKLVHAGLDDPGLRRRFLQERQILARLDHPGIARVFDGGVTDDGRPYLVMDRVEGEALDQWSSSRTLSERLQLFLAVAHAVQFAHGQLVVHCDLKPSNILVDAGGQPRLLDFGIAHVFSAGPEHPDASPIRPFTPLYAAPEQLRGEEARVATDVWQLGLLLFELSAERHPWRECAEDLSLLTRQVLEGPVPAPSRSAPDAVSRRLARGRWRELDAIVGRCLAKVPADRYTTVAELAADVRAFLEQRPVAAAAGGAGYRTVRWLGRHRIAVAATLALGAGLAALGWWSQQRVESQRVRADAMAAFVGAMADRRDPLAGAFEAKELISVSGFEPPPSVVSDPVLQREFVMLSARTLINLGEFQRVVELVEPLLANLDSASDDRDSRRAEYLSLVGYARFRAGDAGGGRKRMTEAWQLMRQAPENYDPESRLLAARRLAQLERAEGLPAAAQAVLGEALTGEQRAPESTPAWLEMGIAAGEAGDYAGAREALGVALEVSPDGPLKVTALAALADVNRLAGDLAASRRLADQSVALAGNDPGMRSLALIARANAARADLDFAGAVDDYRIALGLLRAELGEDHPDSGKVLLDLILSLLLDQRCTEASAMLGQARSSGHLAAASVDTRQRLIDLEQACD